MGHPPPLTENGARRPGESHKDDNGVPQKKFAEAKQRSTPILGLDLDSKKLNLKQVNKSKRLSWENITRATRSWQGTRRKACSEIRIAPRSQHCTWNLDPRDSHHKAPREHWIIGWDHWEFKKNAECSGKQDADCRLSQKDRHETTCQFS